MKKTINISLDKTVHKEGIRIAKSEDRSLSSLLSNLLRKYILGKTK